MRLIPSYIPSLSTRTIWPLSILFVTLLLANCQAPLPEEVEAAYQDLPETVDFNFHIRPLVE
jgi:hypothetical protein